MPDSAYHELKRALKAETKRANQRMVRLEKAALHTPAYDIATNTIRNVLGKETGKTRFNVTKNMSYNDMQVMLKHASKFNKSASSTVSGMKAVVKQRERTLYERYGVRGDDNLNILYQVLTGDEFKKLSALIPSSMVVESITDAISNGMNAHDVNTVINNLLDGENDEFLYDSMVDMFEDEINSGNYDLPFDDDNEYE